MKMTGEITAEHVLHMILDSECFNPADDWGTYDPNDSDTWSARKYNIEGHCTNYEIVAQRTETGYKIVSLETK